MAQDDWRRNVYILALVQLIMRVAMTSIKPFIPLYLPELGVTIPEQVAFWAGVATSVNFVGQVFTQPVWGNLADRYGRKPMVVRSILAVGGFNLLITWAGTVYQLVGLRFLMGTMSGFNAASVALIAAMTPRDRLGYAVGLVQAGQMAGTILGPGLGGGLAELFGYRGTFLVAGSLSLAMAPVVMLGVREEFQRPARATKAQETLQVGSVSAETEPTGAGKSSGWIEAAGSGRAPGAREFAPIPLDEEQLAGERWLKALSAGGNGQDMVGKGALAAEPQGTSAGQVPVAQGASTAGFESMSGGPKGAVTGEPTSQEAGRGIILQPAASDGEGSGLEKGDNLGFWARLRAWLVLGRQTLVAVRRWIGLTWQRVKLLRQATTTGRSLLLISALLVIACSQFGTQSADSLLALFIDHIYAGSRLNLVVALAFALSAAANLLMAPVFGRYGDRYGHWRILHFSLVGMAITVGLQALSANAVQLLVLRTLSGLFAAGILPNAHAIIGNLTPEARRGHAYGVAGSVTAVGNFLGPMTGGIIAALMDLRAVFWVTGVLLLAAEVAVRAMTRVEARS
ncbi:MAG: MFS transporter [Clostridia bacterium]|nr:MFS transporter [Clostridia bacterium]